jgi:hypothetical protein
MRTVAPVTRSEPTTAACARPAQSEAPAMPQSGGRALVLLQPAPTSGIGPAAQRPSAAFLAQLIATAQQAPQTRERRRADPGEVNAVYTAVAAPAAWLGRAVYRAT